MFTGTNASPAWRRWLGWGGGVGRTNPAQIQGRVAYTKGLGGQIRKGDLSPYGKRGLARWRGGQRAGEIQFAWAGKRVTRQGKEDFTQMCLGWGLHSGVFSVRGQEGPGTNGTTALFSLKMKKKAWLPREAGVFSPRHHHAVLRKRGCGPLLWGCCDTGPWLTLHEWVCG